MITWIWIFAVIIISSCDAQYQTCDVTSRVPDIVCGRAPGTQPCPSGSVCYENSRSRTGYCCKHERERQQIPQRSRSRSTPRSTSLFGGINAPCQTPLMHGGNLLTCSPGQRARTCPEPCFTCIPLIGTIVGICCEDRTAGGCGVPGFMSSGVGASTYSATSNALQGPPGPDDMSFDDRSISNIRRDQINTNERELDQPIYITVTDAPPPNPLTSLAGTRQEQQYIRERSSSNQNDFANTNAFPRNNMVPPTSSMNRNSDDVRNMMGNNATTNNRFSPTGSPGEFTQTYPNIRKGYIDEPQVETPTTSRQTHAPSRYDSQPTSSQNTRTNARSMNTNGMTSVGVTNNDDYRMETSAPVFVGQSTIHWSADNENAMSRFITRGNGASQSVMNNATSYNSMPSFDDVAGSSVPERVTEAPLYAIHGVNIDKVQQISSQTITNNAFTVGARNGFQTHTTKSDRIKESYEAPSSISRATGQPNNRQFESTTPAPLNANIPTRNGVNGNSVFQIELYPNNMGMHINDGTNQPQRTVTNITPQPVSNINSDNGPDIHESPQETVYIQPMATQDVVTRTPTMNNVRIRNGPELQETPQDTVYVQPMAKQEVATQTPLANSIGTRNVPEIQDTPQDAVYIQPMVTQRVVTQTPVANSIGTRNVPGIPESTKDTVYVQPMATQGVAIQTPVANSIGTRNVPGITESPQDTVYVQSMATQGVAIQTPAINGIRTNNVPEIPEAPQSTVYIQPMATQGVAAQTPAINNISTVNGPEIQEALPNTVYIQPMSTQGVAAQSPDINSMPTRNGQVIPETPQDTVVYVQPMLTPGMAAQSPIINTTVPPMVTPSPFIPDTTVPTRQTTPATVRIEVPVTRDNVYLLLQRLGIDDISPGYVHAQQNQQQNITMVSRQAMPFFGNQLNSVNGVPISGQSLIATRPGSAATDSPCGGPQPVAMCRGPTNIQCGTGFFCVRTDTTFGVCCPMRQASIINQTPIVSNPIVGNPCGTSAPVSRCHGPNNVQCGTGARCVPINNMFGVCCRIEQSNNVPSGFQGNQQIQPSYPIVTGGRNPDDPCGTGIEPQSMCMGPTNMQCPLATQCVQIEPRFGVCCPNTIITDVVPAITGIQRQNTMNTPLQRQVWAPSVIRRPSPMFFRQSVQGRLGGAG